MPDQCFDDGRLVAVRAQSGFVIGRIAAAQQCMGGHIEAGNDTLEHVGSRRLFKIIDGGGRNVALIQ